MTQAGLDQPLHLPPEGRFDGAEHRYPVRVHFEDTDATGMVYHANYVRFIERARSDMLRLAGIDQRARLDAGEGGYAVGEVQLRYLSPARLHDVLLVVSRLVQVRAAAVVVHQQVRRGAALLADARVTAVLVAASGRPTRQPADWIAIYNGLLSGEPMNQGTAHTS